MAREVIEKLVDDMDGSEAAECVQFGLDGRTYSVDLSELNAESLRSALAPFIAVATPDGNVRFGRVQPQLRRAHRARRTVNLDSGAGSPKAIREWAAQHGKAVSERGRISKELRDEYESAVAV
jgi:hypothetical protein